MKKIYVPDPKEAVNLSRENVYSGFDGVFFMSDGQPLGCTDTDLLDSSPAAFLDAYSKDYNALELLCCVVIQTKKSPAIIGMIAERHPAVGESLMSMMLRQRELIAECFSRWSGVGKSVDEKDAYTQYVAACLSAAARVKAHKLLCEME